MQQGEYNQAVTYLNVILDKNLYDEEIHKMILNCYADLDDYTSLMNHYKNLVKTFKHELGIEPSSYIKKLYNQLYSEKS